MIGLRAGRDRAGRDAYRPALSIRFDRLVAAQDGHVGTPLICSRVCGPAAFPDPAVLRLCTPAAVSSKHAGDESCGVRLRRIVC
jgi:hypothetical protein